MQEADYVGGVDFDLASLRAVAGCGLTEVSGVADYGVESLTFQVDTF